jgi:hypothetical protein
LTNQGLNNFGANMFDGCFYTLAKPSGAAIAQLKRLSTSGTGSTGNSCPTK